MGAQTYAPYVVYGRKPLQQCYFVRECENFFLGGCRFFLSEIKLSRRFCLISSCTLLKAAGPRGAHPRDDEVQHAASWRPLRRCEVRLYR